MMPFIQYPDGSVGSVAPGIDIQEEAARLGGVVIEVIPPAVITPADIAARRYDAEVGGIYLGDLRIATDDRSKTMIAGAALAALRNPDYLLNWKTPAGFVQLQAGQVLAVADAVHAHVQACFDREAALLAMGDAVSPDDLEAGWP